MPTYKVTDPESGKTITLTSQDNTPPTEAELEEIFSSVNQDVFTPADLPEPSKPETQQIEHQNLIGQTFNVPGATSRNAIRANPGLALAGPFAGVAALHGLGGPQAQQAAGEGALNPSAVQTFQDQAIQAGQNAGGGPSTSVAVNFAKGLIPSAAGLAADTLTDPTQVLLSLLTGFKPKKVQPIESVVDKQFIKAISPGVQGRKNFGKLERDRNLSRSAVESIVDNKDTLKLTDQYGNLDKSNLPKSRDQFSQAISQTKKVIFNKYDALAKEAGEQGAIVPTQGIADEIMEAISSPAMEDLSPTVQNYGLELAKRLEARRSYTLPEAQDAIEALNNKLKTYFNNPTPEALHQAVIDRAVVNNLRNLVVSKVEGVKGPGYDILRKQYGALNAIEDSVTRAALKDKKIDGGFSRLFDVLSQGDIIQGILSFNPATVAKGGFQLGARKIFSNMNNPNKIVEKMFKEVDRIKNTDPKLRTLQHLLKQSRPVLRTLPASGKTLTEER